MSFKDNIRYALKNNGIYNFISSDLIHDHEAMIRIIAQSDLCPTDGDFIDYRYGSIKLVKVSNISGLKQKAISYVKFPGSNNALSINTIKSFKEGSVIVIDNNENILNYNELYRLSNLKKYVFLLLTNDKVDNIYLKNFEIPLPNKAELIESIKRFFRESKINIPDSMVEQVSNFVTGIPVTKMREILNYSVFQFKENKKDFFKTLLEEKKKYFKLNLSMEFIEEIEKMSSLGGQSALKAWLKERELAISVKAQESGIPFPKGLLLVGIQGCGKSLTAKSISSLWKMPLIKMDFSLLFTSDKTPETTFKENLMMAEKLSPIILWLDEIDKLFSASSSEGVIELKRILGTFLTWLQEKKSKVFVIATANKIDDIPPELLRKGRFDEIFFLDLPKENERREIFKIHMKKRGLKEEEFDLETLVEKSDFFSGSEIEQVIVSALYKGFSLNKKIDDNDLLSVIEETIPFYNTYEENIKELKKWAEDKARKASFDDEAYALFEE